MCGLLRCGKLCGGRSVPCADWRTVENVKCAWTFAANKEGDDWCVAARSNHRRSAGERRPPPEELTRNSVWLPPPVDQEHKNTTATHHAEDFADRAPVNHLDPPRSAHSAEQFIHLGEGGVIGNNAHVVGLLAKARCTEFVIPRVESNEDGRLATALEFVKHDRFSQVDLGRDRVQRTAWEAEELGGEATVTSVAGDRTCPNRRLRPREGVPVWIGDPEHHGGVRVSDAPFRRPEEVGERSEGGEKGLYGAWGERPHEAHEGYGEEIDDPLPEAAGGESGCRAGCLAADRRRGRRLLLVHLGSV